jgi:hypothetical protein
VIFSLGAKQAQIFGAYIQIAGNCHKEKEDENDYRDCLQLNLLVASEFIEDPAEDAEKDT